MSQNLLTLTLTDADYADIDKALDTLEQKFSGLRDLSITERRAIPKMGLKSEAFCRHTLNVLAQNKKMVPESVDLVDLQNDLLHLEALRIRGARFRQLMGRLEDSEMALGSDVMAGALHGYGLLKMLGKGSGLDVLKQDIGARFYKSPRQPKDGAKQ